MLILGLETSCDETAASILEVKKGRIQVLSNIISSQIKLHQKWGGVVPNLAAREHLKNIFTVLKNALQEARVKPADLDFIGVTAGPGLIPALLIGVNATKTLAYVWKKPLLGIHHIEGHIYANFIGDKIRECQMSNVECRNLINYPNSKQAKNYKLKAKSSNIKFPILCLVVSGGHTQLVLMKKHLHYQIIGETQDDAVGEAFDKVARILGLGYPGGPAIAQRAMEFPISIRQLADQSPNKSQKTKHKKYNYKINFPRPMINNDNFNFSFSGLKTAVLYETKKHPELMKKSDYITTLCHEFQKAATEVLIAKTLRAAQKYHPRSILLAGGVSANLELRKQLGKTIHRELKNTLYIIPDTLYSIDNSAMIAAATYFRWKLSPKKNHPWQTIEADANLKLSSL